MFYQSANSLGANLWKLERNENLNFPFHLHTSFEWITVTEGEMIITIDKIPYTLTSGDALLIFPDQVHSFETPVHSAHVLCIFSPKLVQAYTNSIRDKLPISNLFRPSRFYVDRLSCDPPISEFEIKGLLYSICGEFDRGASYTERRRERDGLLSKIFLFVEANYNKDCTLEALARDTSYHYVYLSRYFKQCTGLSFTEYVNRYRIHEAGYILKNTEQTILQTAYDCGFDSLRSFNRNFKRVTGLTPQEYKERIASSSLQSYWKMET